MDIRLGKTEDYLQIAELKWLHMEEDDLDYGEANLLSIIREDFVSEYVTFLESDTYYKVFVAEENGIIISAMFLGILPKLPKPNSQSKSIGYLTSVFTRKEYRNQGIGTKVLDFIKKYSLEQKCELLFVWPSEKSISWYERNGFSNQNEIFECGLLGE